MMLIVFFGMVLSFFLGLIVGNVFAPVRYIEEIENDGLSDLLPQACVKEDEELKRYIERKKKNGRN